MTRDGVVSIGPHVRRRAELMRQAGAAARLIDPTELSERLPLLARWEGDALLDEDGGVIRTRAAIEMLGDALADAMVFDEVLSVRPTAAGTVQLRAGGVTVEHARVVVCAGRETASLARSAGVDGTAEERCDALVEHEGDRIGDLLGDDMQHQAAEQVAVGDRNARPHVGVDRPLHGDEHRQAGIGAQQVLVGGLGLCVRVGGRRRADELNPASVDLVAAGGIDYGWDQPAERTSRPKGPRCQMAPISRGFLGRRRENVDPSRVPPGQYVTHDFPVLSAGPTPHTDLDDWTFTIDGAVDTSVSWSWSELTSLPADTITRDIHCVTKWSKLDTEWKGVPVEALLDGVQSEAKYVTAWSDGGYTTNLSLEDVTGGKAWVAYEYDGQALEPEHGGPARLLVPALYFWKSAKWVRGLTLTLSDEPGFWEGYGYHNHGDPWREQRYQGD